MPSGANDRMRHRIRTIIAVTVFGAGGCIAPAVAQTGSAWPDTFLARVESLALLETLNATLLAARSATFTLDKWCADYKLSDENVKIRARLARDVDKPVTAEQRRRLRIGDQGAGQIPSRRADLPQSASIGSRQLVCAVAADR